VGQQCIPVVILVNCPARALTFFVQWCTYMFVFMWNGQSGILAGVDSYFGYCHPITYPLCWRGLGIGI